MTKGPLAAGAAAAAAAAAAAPAKLESGTDAKEEAAAAPAAAGEAKEEAAADGGAAAGEAKQPPPNQPTPKSKLSDPATLDELRAVAMGCCVALPRPGDAAALGLDDGSEGATGGEPPLALACWRGRASLNVLVSKQEAAQLVERIQEARAKLAAGGGGSGNGAAAQPEPELVAA